MVSYILFYIDYQLLEYRTAITMNSKQLVELFLQIFLFQLNSIKRDIFSGADVFFFIEFK